MRIRWIAAGSLLLCMPLLVACTPEPIPELLAAAAPNPQTAPVLSGPPLQACLDDAPSVEVPTLEYSPGVTYKMAEIIQRTYKKGGQFAPSLRAYTGLTVNRGLFGQEVRRKLACYYISRDGDLTYVANILADEDFRVDAPTFTSTGGRIYRQMSGDSYWKTFFSL